jgi:DNA invertase Pin-like site-specific DNA recombinase
MTMYGYVRCPRGSEKLIETQVAEMARKAEELGGSLTEVLIDERPFDAKHARPERSDTREKLKRLQAGDTLIINSLDRLGCSIDDVRRTMRLLSQRGVRLYALHEGGKEADLDPNTTDALLHIFTMQSRVEKSLRSERMTEVARSRKELGLACGRVPMGKRILQQNGLKILVWDSDELDRIAEIAERLPTEGPKAVARDFRRRRIKDRRGRPWGKPVPKNCKPLQQVNIAIRGLLGRQRPINPYEKFQRAARWFHRMRWKGLLPEPYLTMGLMLPEPKGFREEPRPKGWTPGGTERREQERAARRAERRARWKEEKAARVKARVHKPKITPKLGEGPAKEDRRG